MYRWQSTRVILPSFVLIVAGRPPINKPTSGMGMPKLEPMENIKLMADGQAGPSRSMRQAVKRGEVTLGQSKLVKCSMS